MSRIRALSPLSPPVAFTAFWAFGVTLAQIHVLAFQGPWSAMAWAVMVAVPLAFVCGGAVGSALVDARGPAAAEVHANPRTGPFLRKLLAAFVLIGFLEVVHQSAVAGTVPLLSGSIDQSRVGLPGGPTILLLELLTVAAVVSLSLARNLLARESRYELAICAASLGLFALEGGRGAMLLPVVVAVLARCLYWGLPRIRLLAVAAVVVTAAVSGVFFLRTSQNPSEAFQAEFYNHVVPDAPSATVPVLPLDIAIATNFQALAAIVDHFPNAEPYGGGRFDVVAINRFVPGSRSIGTVSRELTAPWVTSTVAGPLWADGGMPVVVVGLALIGLISTAAYRYFRRTRAFRHALVAAYLLYLVLFGVYVNFWTQFVNWVIAVPALLVVGALAEDPRSPPGLGGWTMRLLARLQAGASKIITTMRTKWGGLPALLAVAALVLIGLTVIGGLIRRNSPGGGVQVSAKLAIEGAAQPRKGAAFATDGDLPSDNAPLWWIDAGPTPALHELATSSKDGAARQVRQLSIARLAPGESFDISTWGRLSRPAVFVMRRTDRGVSVRVERPGSAKTIASGEAVLAPPAPGVTRDLSIATWTGNRPDLFVIDRGLNDDRTQVRVISGESRFSDKILDVKAPISGLDPAAWAVDIGDVVGPAAQTDRRPDLVLVRRAAPGSATPEVHVLAGEAKFQQFELERVLALRESIVSQSSFAIGSSLGAPTLYAIAPASWGERTLRQLRLAAPAPAL